MNAIAITAPALDLPTLVADAMVDSGIFDSLIEGLSRTLKAIPRRVVAWLGPELHTPTNSSPPLMTLAEPGLWNGVVFVESNEASYWLLTKANPGNRLEAHRPTPPFTGRDPYRQPNQYQPREPSGTQSLWPEAAPQHDPRYDQDPWR